MIIDSPYLPPAPTYSAATLTQISETNYATLATIGYGEETDPIVIENPSGAEVLPSDWGEVIAVVANGRSLTRAADPESPQIGEYLYNPYTNTVEVFVEGELRSILVYGSPLFIPFIPTPLFPPFPAVFANLPLIGQIQLTRSIENHPTAQFELESTLSKSQLQAIFAPGGELDMYGIGLRINSPNITELPRAVYPDARCKISVSLGGKWENYVDELVFLRPDGKNNTPSDNPFTDGDCLTPTGSSSTAFNITTTVSELLSKAGMPYLGPTLKTVTIERGTPRDATVTPVQLLQERVRVANGFIRWSNVQAVEVVPIDAIRVWTYNESEIIGEVETSFEAIARTNKKPITFPNLNPALPDLVNFPATVTPPPIPALKNELPLPLGFEYPNVELTGQFTETARDRFERTQGQSQPRYVRKEPTKTTRVDGDKNAHVPLDGVTVIRVMSLCFDIGGQTKNRSTTYEEDGATIWVDDEIWGFLYTGDEIRNDATGQLVGDPNQYWQLLKYTRTTYIYDLGTGYLLYTYTSGFNTVRYRQESTETPETLDLDPSDPEYQLYKFFKIPVAAQSSSLLRLQPDYTSSGLFELIKVCNRDGTSSYRALINPDYAPPYYAERSLTESVAFASTQNPDDENLLLIVGEESRFEEGTEVIEAVYEEKLIGFDDGYPTYTRGDEISPQKNIKYIKQFKAQGQQIAEALEETFIEESTGELPTATRKPPVYELEQPQSTNNFGYEQQYRYYIRTAGYTERSPVGGSENFAVANTLNEALTAARCKLAIENWRNGFSETLQIPVNLAIKEGDRFDYFLNGEFRKRVVLSVTHTFNILGVVAGIPRITATTSLTLGPWVLPDLEYSKIAEPNVEIVVLNVVSQTLGGILEWNRVRSRRNPQGEEM